MNVVPIGRVHNSRPEPIEDAWDTITSTIVLDKSVFDADTVLGLDEFTHVEVIYLFDRVDPNIAMTSMRPPRDNPAWPVVGIFAQRGPGRPNRLGTAICRLVAVEGITITVVGLDAIDGTPVIDLKPWATELGPRGDVRQPRWATELMSEYW